MAFWVARVHCWVMANFKPTSLAKSFPAGLETLMAAPHHPPTPPGRTEGHKLQKETGENVYSISRLADQTQVLCVLSGKVRNVEGHERVNGPREKPRRTEEWLKVLEEHRTPSPDHAAAEVVPEVRHGDPLCTNTGSLSWPRSMLPILPPTRGDDSPMRPSRSGHPIGRTTFPRAACARAVNRWAELRILF